MWLGKIRKAGKQESWIQSLEIPWSHGRGCSFLLCRGLRAQFCRTEQSGGATEGDRARKKPEELREEQEKDVECREKGGNAVYWLKK